MGFIGLCNEEVLVIESTTTSSAYLIGYIPGGCPYAAFVVTPMCYDRGPGGQTVTPSTVWST